MLIRCWGARGSVPVSGRQYLVYGGDTTCVEVRTGKGEVIVLDAGTGIRPLGVRLVEEGVRRIHLLFTHFHWDHLQGFPFFRPLYRPETELFVAGRDFYHDSLEHALKRVMRAPFFPVNWEEIPSRIRFEELGEGEFSIDSVKLSTVAISHPNFGLGYRLEEGGRSFVFIPDNELDFIHPGGLEFDAYVGFCRGADLLVHDAEYKRDDYRTTRTWGHSLYESTVELAVRAGVRRLGLHHHNQDRPDVEVDGIVEDSRRLLRERQSGAECVGMAAGLEFVI
jgi:phosphoribosyl 1,2-cyclic phosphodiesterase